jgi:hypothetical protein
MSELREPSPEEQELLKQLTETLQKALDPTAGMSEQDKAKAEVISLVHNSLDSGELIKRMATHQNNNDSGFGIDGADLFAAGILSELHSHGLLAEVHKVTGLFGREIVAHWLRMYERHIKNEEL